jgi:hypothetical protein
VEGAFSEEKALYGVRSIPAKAKMRHGPMP